jgi:predicted nucleic-acid-binding protein
VIGVDTNVLIRYLVRDDPLQFERARDFIKGRLSRAEPGFISNVVLLEAVWVLRRFYRVRGADLAEVLEQLIAADTILVENAQEVAEAVALAKLGHDVADALISALARKAGCSHTVTFDKKALRLPGFAAL